MLFYSQIKKKYMKKLIIPFVAVFFLTAFTLSSSIGHEEAGRTVSAELIGANEIPGPGDPDGSGYVEITLNQGQGTISYVLTVQNIDPATAAHIHIGPVGVAGPPVVHLAAPTNGSSSGTIHNVDKDLIKAIRQNPGDYYVNVHNSVYPPGAIRGQLSK
jgi:hypothetical protein